MVTTYNNRVLPPDDGSPIPINSDMTVREILARLVDNGIKTWSMRVDSFGELVIFIGPEAPIMRARALGACYGAEVTPPKE